MWFVFSSHLASFRKKSIVETLVACFGFVLSSQLASLHKEEYGSGGHHLLWTCFQLSSCQPSQEEHGRDFVHLECFQLSSIQPSQKEYGRDSRRLLLLCSQLSTCQPSQRRVWSGGHQLLWTCFQLSFCQPSQEEHGRDFVHLERFQLSSSQPSQEHGRDCHRLLCICGSSSTLIYPSPRKSRPKATVTMASWTAEAHRRSDPCLIASYKEPQVSNVFPFFTLRTA